MHTRPISSNFDLTDITNKAQGSSRWLKALIPLSEGEITGPIINRRYGAMDYRRVAVQGFAIHCFRTELNAQ